MNNWKKESAKNLPVSTGLMAIEEDLQVLLQELVDSLSVYAHLAPKDDSREAAAMVLFQQWLELEQQEKRRRISLRGKALAEIMDLARRKRTGEEGLRMSRSILEDWQQADAWRVCDTGSEQTALRFCIRPTADTLMLEQLFEVRLEHFLYFYLQCLANAGESIDSRLAIHFLNSVADPVELVGG